MGNTLYVGSVTAPTVSPAYSGDWDVTASAIRRKLLKAAPYASETMTTITIDAEGAALAVQLVGPMMMPGHTIDGRWLCQVRAMEALAGDDIMPYIGIFVWNSTGTTLRTTLKNVFQVGTEFATALTNHSWSDASSMSSYVTQWGDRIVVELGGAGRAGAQLSLRLGASAASDLPVDESTVTDLRPWFQLDTATVKFVGDVQYMNLKASYLASLPMKGSM